MEIASCSFTRCGICRYNVKEGAKQVAQKNGSHIRLLFGRFRERSSLGGEEQELYYPTNGEMDDGTTTSIKPISLDLSLLLSIAKAQIATHSM
jgi:hypothetical protein